MTDSFKDISGKVEAPVVEALGEIDAVTRTLCISFLLVGARARDIFFSVLFAVQTNRETMDIDLGIQVRGWSEFESLVYGLLERRNFTRDKRVSHRLLYKGFLGVDIIPFGEIEEPAGSIRWPSDDQSTMSTVGFSEAMENAITVRLRSDPDLDVRIPTPAGMAIMKLISWHEKYPERKKDAIDLLFLMKEYINAGNDDRLHAEDSDIVAMEDFDYDMASPRLLGRDMSRIAGTETLLAIRQILDEETSEDSSHRLVLDMTHGKFLVEDLFKNTVNLVKQLRAGILDGDKTEPAK